MVDVGPVVTREHNSMGADDDDLLVFVERLAAAGQGDPATARARDEIRRVIHAGSPPPGLRRLAEALAASAAETPPPRHPVDGVTSVVPAMQAHTLVELTDADPAEVGAVITALIADGRRVVVTAETDVELGVVRGEVAQHAFRVFTSVHSQQDLHVHSRVDRGASSLRQSGRGRHAKEHRRRCSTRATMLCITI